MGLILIKLTKKYEKQLIEMIDEWRADQELNHTDNSPWAIFKDDPHDFDFYLENLECKKETESRVPDSVFFLLDEERDRLLGAVNIRHCLNDRLRKEGGHIGDGVRPSERRKGYGTELVRLALNECRKLGIDRVLMFCDKDNIGSAKTITKNGGVLDEEFVNEDGVIEQKYLIDLNKGTDYQDINAATIDRWIEEGWEWGIPVDRETYLRATRGEWDVKLTPTKPVPHEWFGELKGKKVLGLASGGGQQMPIFAALGADCTVLDYSVRQIESERMVAEREGYKIRIVRADMSKPLPFEDGEFDIIFNPVSNCYIREVKPVWKECHRVLKPGGILLAGLDTGINYIVDGDEKEIVNSLPFDPLANEEQRLLLEREDCGMQFSHTLEEQIGGQLEAGFELLALYEDTNGEGRLHEMNIPSFVATRSVRKGITEKKDMEKLIAYCGLDCGKCDAYLATKNDDDALREKTAKYWSELNGITILPEQINCEGCRMNGKKTVFCDSLCGIRQCGLKKGFETCGDCPDMETCETLSAVTSNNEAALDNLRRK